jgi:predicted unusual protein kinase regulating ubiquinone biosynthesis (AarF/ABC1/UbiB family)
VPGDIRVTKAFIRLAEWLFKDLNMQWYSDEVEDNLPLELDFQLEANNA